MMISSRCVRLGKSTNASGQICTNRSPFSEGIRKCECSKRSIRKVECQKCVLPKGNKNNTTVWQASTSGRKKKFIEEIKEKPLFGCRGSAKRTPFSLKKVTKKKPVAEKETRNLSKPCSSTESIIIERILKDLNRVQQTQQSVEADMEPQPTQESPQQMHLESSPQQPLYQIQEAPSSLQEQSSINSQQQQHQELSNCKLHSDDCCPKIDDFKIEPAEQIMPPRDIGSDNEVKLENEKKMTISTCQNLTPAKSFPSFRGEYPTRHRAGTCLQQFCQRRTGKSLQNSCSEETAPETTRSCSATTETQLVSIDLPDDGYDPGATEDANAGVESGSVQTVVGCCPGAGPPIGATMGASTAAYDEYNLQAGQMSIDCFAQQQHKHQYQWKQQQSQMLGNGWLGQATHQSYDDWPTSGSTQQPYEEAWQITGPQEHRRMSQYPIQRPIAAMPHYYCGSNQAYGKQYIDALDPMDGQNISQALVPIPQSMLIEQCMTPQQTFNHTTQQTYQLADGQILQQKPELSSQAYVSSQVLLQHSDRQQAEQKPTKHRTDQPHQSKEPIINLTNDDSDTKRNTTNIREMNVKSSGILPEMTNEDNLLPQPKILVGSTQMDNYYQLVYAEPHTSFPQSPLSQQQSSPQSVGKFSRQNFSDPFISKSMAPISIKAKSMPPGSYIQSVNEQMHVSLSACNVYSPTCRNTHCCSACCRQRFAQMRFMMPHWR